MLKRILFGGESGLSAPTNIGMTLLRIFAGVTLMMAHGRGKLPPSEDFISSAASIGFPSPTLFAWAASLSEFVGGAFLALGFLTRVSGFFICCVMVTALLGVHRADPFAKQELAFLYFFTAFAFMLRGAGDWSIDRYLR